MRFGRTLWEAMWIVPTQRHGSIKEVRHLFPYCKHTTLRIDRHVRQPLLAYCAEFRQGLASRREAQDPRHRWCNCRIRTCCLSAPSRRMLSGASCSGFYHTFYWTTLQRNWLGTLSAKGAHNRQCADLRTSRPSNGGSSLPRWLSV
jgi:hypothetical protein